MACDPHELAAAAVCLCFDEKTRNGAEIYALCAWANGGAPPPVSNIVLGDPNAPFIFGDPNTGVEFGIP